MMMTRIVLTVLLTAATAAGAAAQSDPGDRIRASLERARDAGLPVELLESKVAEGRAKNVPLDRIATAIEQRAAALQRAQGVLASALEPGQFAAEDMAVGADAIQAGVDDAALARIAASAGGDRRTVAIATLAQLVTAGIVPEEALGQVEAALVRGNEALMNLPAAAGGNAIQGGPPAGVPASGRPPGTGKPPETPPGKPGNGPPGGGGV